MRKKRHMAAAAALAAAGALTAASAAFSAVEEGPVVCPGPNSIPPITEGSAAVDDIPTLPIGAGNKVLATSWPEPYPDPYPRPYPPPARPQPQPDPIIGLPEPDIDPTPFQG